MWRSPIQGRPLLLSPEGVLVTVIVYGVDQKKGIEAYHWSGDLEEILENDYGLSEKQERKLRCLKLGESALIIGVDGACHRVKCVGLDDENPRLRLVL